MEVLLPSRRNLCLSVGNRISIFYLEQQDEKDLADRNLFNARRNWPNHGHVPLRVRHDCSQSRCVRSGTYSLRAPQDHFSAPRGCHVKLLARAGVFVLDHS